MRLNLASKIGLIVAFVAVLLVGGVVGVAFARDRSTYDVIPENTYVEGVDVSGMTADEATAVLEAKAQADVGSITLSLIDNLGAAHPVSLAAGVSYDVSAAVDEALDRNRERAALSRILDDATGTELPEANIVLTVSVDTSALRDQVAALEAEINCEPTDAYRDFNDDNTVTLHEAVDGRALDVDASVAAAEAALSEATAAGLSLSELVATPVSAQLAIATTPASVYVADLPPCIIVDYDWTTLYVFGAGSDQVIFSCGIGYGLGTNESGTYKSPEGLHYIEYKDPAPTWTNPDPTGWGSSYPAVVYPGDERNPLGVRALKISDAPQIFIHGVYDAGLIHTNLSHGCINVYNDDVVQLYDLIPEPSDVSTPIYVYFHGTQQDSPGAAASVYAELMGWY